MFELQCDIICCLRNRLHCLLCESTPGSLFSRPHFEVWPILQAELNVIHGLATLEFHEGRKNQVGVLRNFV